MKNLKLLITSIALIFAAGSCDYLDVVPDNVATIDIAFSDRTGVEKYLFTCYNYLPNHGNAYSNPAIMGGDEIWMYYPVTVYYGNTTALELARGEQNVNSPLMNFWDGENYGKSMFQAIRDCNIFLERVDEAQDLEAYERDRMVAEVKFLKAYYHFYLMRAYGPIPITKENLPISSHPDDVKVVREPIIDVVNYIVELLDEAAEGLPLKVQDRSSENGRVTKATAMAIKAKVLTTAASPLFNGNPDLSIVQDDVSYDATLWTRAAEACREAIEVCASAGHELYFYTDALPINDSTRLKMNIRNSVCDKWNNELIWGNSSSSGRGGNIQNMAHPHLDPAVVRNQTIRTFLAPPIGIAEQFYSSNGVPINEDTNWDYEGRFGLRTATFEERYYIEEGYETAKLNFDREPRFYATLGFDGGKWYGQGKLSDEEAWTFKNKKGQTGARVSAGLYTVTGYTVKKLVNFENTVPLNGYSRLDYPWPVMRLADLYLLYAEALNESNGPSADVYTYLDMVRNRAGLSGVVESWANHSINPSKPSTKEGLREIIQQERLIELSMEGQRFWDIRRWKTAGEILNRPIKGWDISGETSSEYYKVLTLFSPEFTNKEYFWPIKQENLIINSNLIQNPGW